MSSSSAPLPKGIELERDRISVDADLTLTQLTPETMLISRTAGKTGPWWRPFRGRGARVAKLPNNTDPIGWASCRCSKNGGCTVVTKPNPDGSKVTISCDQGSCKGSCSLTVGSWDLEIGKAITALLIERLEGAPEQ
jgi:hypothetical protein